LTLFPKCFSSFDHSTCALSVSGPYLALDEIYHPFRAAFPNNSTRRGSFTQAQSPVADGILTLSDGPSQGTWTGTEPEASSPNYNSDPRGGPDFKFELLPLHSPLLRQSRLVSFPPLIDMLKFSGYPYLIRGQPKGGRPIVRLDPRSVANGAVEDDNPCINRPKGPPSGSRHCLSGPSPPAQSHGWTSAQPAKRSLRGWQ
jgi:hypothetical protein